MPGLRRLSSAVIAALGAGVALVALGPAANAAPTTASFVAAEDTFVASSSPTTASGSASTVKVDHTPDRISYFKFKVANLPAGASVSTATLTLWTNSSSQPATTLDVYNVPSTWTEATNYNTRPALGSKIGSINASGPSVKMTLNVPVTGNGTVSFAVWRALTGANDTQLISSENTNYADRRPALAVTYDIAQTPSPAPGPDFPGCPTNVVKPFTAGTTSSSQWKVSSPPATATYDITGYTNTSYPNGSASPITIGSTTPGQDLCLLNGTVSGTTDDSLGWSYYHDQQNAPCVRLVATRMVQVNGLNCHDAEDGLKFLENTASTGNSNTTTFYSRGVHLDRIRDDCMENDFAVGGVVSDSLWERCNSGLSERPADSNGAWTSPAGETVTFDHSLMGLWDTWHEDDNANGSNGLFKWSTSANHLVLKCSTFYVPSKSLNGADAMAIPAGTVVDDSACPNSPTTIVWTGGGAYPGNLQGLPIRVTADKSVWDNAVAAWKAAH